MRWMAVIAVLVGGLAFARHMGWIFGESDQVLIERALDESIQASKEGRPGGVMDFLSRELTFNEQQVGNWREVSRFIREQRPDVEVQDRKVVLLGDDRAEMRSPVRLSLKVLGFSQSVTIPEVRIEFEKESGRRYVVFPDRRWRVVRVHAPDFDPARLAF